MSAFWKQIDGSFHEMRGNEHVVAQIITRETSWSQFNVNAPDWWWRILVDDVIVVEGMVDERVDEVIDTAYQAAILAAETAMDQVIQELDKSTPA